MEKLPVDQSRNTEQSRPETGHRWSATVRAPRSGKNDEHRLLRQSKSVASSEPRRPAIEHNIGFEAAHRPVLIRPTAVT